MSRLIIAAGGITSSPVFARRFRGKPAKEVYRCIKGIALTGSVTKPLGFAAAQIPAEMSKGVIYTAVGQIGEGTIGYISGIGFFRYIYKVVQPGKIKKTVRLIYNVAALPMTFYSKGITTVFNVAQVSKFKEWWFGERVYIFDDNRIWIEKNFTLGDVFNTLEESK